MKTIKSSNNALFICIIFIGCLSTASVCAQDNSQISLDNSKASLWQGTWEIIRTDTTIKRANAVEVLSMDIFHEKGSPIADINWVAGKGICIEINSEPCEWVGRSSTSEIATIKNKKFISYLKVSTDETDPFELKLTLSDKNNNVAYGTLKNYDNSFIYKVEARRQK